MKKHSVLVLVLLGIGANGLPAHAASEPTSSATSERAAKRASERFQQGVALYREGSFDAALAEFERAYELSPNYRVLYNIGQVHVQRGDYVRAVESFSRYLDEGAGDVSSKRREQVKEEIERLEGRIATLRVRGNVDGAELWVDGTKLGTLPMAEARVNAGVRRVVVKKQGFVDHEVQLTLAGEDTTEVPVELQAQSADAAPEPAETEVAPPPDEEPTTRVAEPAEESTNTGFWISLAATGGAAVATTIFGLRTRAAEEDYEDELKTYPGSSKDISQTRDTMSRNALITDVCAGLTVVGLGATLYFAISGSGSAPEQPQADQATLHTGPSGLGWQISGQF